MNQVHTPNAMGPLALFASVAAAIFVGGSGTLVVQRMLAPAQAPRPVEEPLGGGAADPRLAQALLDLAAELRANRAAPSPLAVPAAEPSQRRALGESGDSGMAELAAAVRELRAALQHGSVGSASASLPALTRPREDFRALLPALPPEEQDHERAYTRQHLFWSEQQILERYGLPDSINVSGAGLTTWNYSDSAHDGARSFYVRFFEGRVISVEGD